MSDRFAGALPSLTAPFSRAFAVVPDDAQDLTESTRGLNVGTTGTVRVTMFEGGEVSLTVAAGITLPVRVTRVWATGTTATNIVALS